MIVIVVSVKIMTKPFIYTFLIVCITVGAFIGVKYLEHKGIFPVEISLKIKSLGKPRKGNFL